MEVLGQRCSMVAAGSPAHFDLDAILAVTGQHCPELTWVGGCSSKGKLSASVTSCSVIGGGKGRNVVIFGRDYRSWRARKLESSGLSGASYGCFLIRLGRRG